MAITAVELGHEYLALTDHSPRLTVANGLTAARLREQLELVAAVDERSTFRLLSGIEVDILDDGALDQEPEMLDRLDVVVASVHNKLAMDGEAMTRRILAAVTESRMNVLGHCTGRLITPRSHTGKVRPQSQYDRAAVFAACAAVGRGRDQLQPAPARPAARPDAPGARRRLPVLDRHRRPRARPAGLAGLRLRPGRSRSASRPAGSTATPSPRPRWPAAAVTDRYP